MAVLTAAIGVFFAGILALVVFWQTTFYDAYYQPYLAPNVFLLPLAGLVLLGALWLRGRLAGMPARSAPRGWALAAYFAALFAAQVAVVRSLWFYPGWDVLNVYTYAQQLANGVAVDGGYFRLCPNNAPLTVLLSAPLWVAGKLGLAVPYAVLPYLGALTVNLSCLLCVLCVRRITPSRFARAAALVLCTVWIAFSMTMTIPYTDAYAIVFPVLALYLSLSRMRTFPKWFWVTLVCFVGASIKPTVLIFLIALLLVSALRTLPARLREPALWRRAAAVAAALVLGALPGKLWQDAATASLAGSPVPQEQLSETHYLMLGMNGDTFGGHSPGDVVFSTSFDTLAQRRQANLARAWERVSARTLPQNAVFFATKAYKAFSDGMLASNNSYLVLERPTRTDALSRFLQKVFRAQGEYEPLWMSVLQGIWLLMLLLGVTAMVGRGRRRAVVQGLAVTLFGLACYLLLFEVWPRYLFLYAPLFVVLAALGLENLRLPRRAHKTPASPAKEGEPHG